MYQFPPPPAALMILSASHLGLTDKGATTCIVVLNDIKTRGCHLACHSYHALLPGKWKCLVIFTYNERACEAFPRGPNMPRKESAVGMRLECFYISLRDGWGNVMIEYLLRVCGGDFSFLGLLQAGSGESTITMNQGMSCPPIASNKLPPSAKAKAVQYIKRWISPQPSLLVPFSRSWGYSARASEPGMLP